VDGPGTDPLLLGLAAGDERVFAAVYDRFGTRMYRVALRLLGCREDAEDAVQDVFLSAVRSRKKLGEARDLDAYLFSALHRAAGRCALRRARAVRASREAAQEGVVPVEHNAPESPDWHRLQQALEHLPEEQREVVTLKIDGELTFVQIAEVIGVNAHTAASRYYYALRKLKASLVGTRVPVPGRL
jgi:RNA polymerase sigma-70 factor, ECF subfamily